MNNILTGGNGILLALVVIVAAAGLYLFFWPRLRRRLILSRPFPEAWLAILREKLPFYTHLPPDQQTRLQQHIQLFLDDKHFVGCAGLAVTDVMRVTVAAQACLLLLNRPSREYSDCRSIYIYPSPFKATRDVRDELGLVSRQSHGLLGESWSDGKVILAWDSVEDGVRDFTDGHNVVLHEFAHQLDHESGATNGAPLLYTRAAYKSWARVFSAEFEQLQQRAGQASIIDHYGATNPAEFFAVATETFFEEPVKLYRHHRELYQQLADYYRLDPRQWQDNR